MTVFLSYSSADKKLAERLREELQCRGVSVRPADSAPIPGSEWVKEMEAAIRSADAILVLARPNGEADEAQRFTWQEALTAVWQDAAKRIVPILLGDAKVPTFIYSSGIPFQAVRIPDPRDLSVAAQSIADLLWRRWRVVSRETDLRIRGMDTDTGDVAVKQGRGPIPDEVESERTERLSEVRRYAESLKARG
jgi:hypothetical protein